MNQNQSPEIHDFITGSTDERAIQDYLAVQDDGEIARLAALMAPKQKTFDPAALVDAAMALQTETKAGLIRRRMAMVNYMNYRTLLSLQNKLGLLLSPYVDDDDERLHDPIAGPVLSRMLSTIFAGYKQSDALEKTEITSVLASADTRTTLSRPTLPCDLEYALRYATNSPKVQWMVLQDAFVDFLGINRITRVQGQREEDEKSLKEQIEHTVQIIAEIKMNPNSDSEKLNSAREHEEELKRFQNRLTSLEAETKYGKSFVPGAIIPSDVEKASSEIFANYWQEPKSVKSEKSVAWFSTEFNAFWEKHSGAYKKIHAAAEKARSAKAEKNRKAAKKGSASREGKRWVKQTENFVMLLNANRATLSNRSDLIEKYAAQHSGVRSDAAKLKVQGFLATLASYSDREFDGLAMGEILRNIGIKDLNEEAIRQCLMLMKSVSEKVIGKKLKKTL